MSHSVKIVIIFIIIIMIAYLIGFEVIMDSLTVPSVELPEFEVDPSVPITPVDWTPVYIAIPLILGIIIILAGIRIIRPVERSAVETFGKYSRFQASGITWIIPVIQKLYRVNITEIMEDVREQETITKDNLNAKVDAQVYYKVQANEQSLKKALYNVNDYKFQIVQLARTTLRNVIGQETFKEVNSNRSKLNKSVFDSISKEAEKWGIEIIRVELKEIQPPSDVQDTMNRVIKAENTKDAEKDFALARQEQANGIRMAQIKKAEGEKRATILVAEGEASAIIKVAVAKAKQIEFVYKSAQKYFRKEAVVLKHLEVTDSALKDNTKYVLTEKGITPTIVLNESADKIIPAPKDFKRSKEEEEELKKYVPSTSSELKSTSKGQSDYTDDLTKAMTIFES